MYRIHGNRRLILGAALGLGFGLATCGAGCSSLGATGSSDATPAAAAVASTHAAGGGSDSACHDALSAVSHYGPSTVKLLAEGHEAVSKAGVQLLVIGLDGAADAAGSPQSKQAIQTLANAYDDYFDLSSDAVSIPLSTLLKDTVDFESVCN